MPRVKAQFRSKASKKIKDIKTYQDIQGSTQSERPFHSHSLLKKNVVF